MSITTTVRGPPAEQYVPHHHQPGSSAARAPPGSRWAQIARITKNNAGGTAPTTLAICPTNAHQLQNITARTHAA